MTKNEMIKILQERETTLWLELASYDVYNKPIFINQIDSMEWDITDAERKVILNKWTELNSLMETMGIETLFNREACEMNSLVWKRERDARKLA